MGDKPLLPCSNCGIDLSDRDYEETTTYADAGTGFTFGGETATHEVPAYVCPECGHVGVL